MTYHHQQQQQIKGVILNLPFQEGGKEGKAHLKAKIKVAQALANAGYVCKYEEHFWCYPDQPADKPFRVDVYLPAHNICVEVDGKTHSSRRAKSKDAWKDENLESIGKRVIRIPVEEALGYPEQILSKLPPPEIDVRSDVEMIKEEVIAWPGPFVSG